MQLHAAVNVLAQIKKKLGIFDRLVKIVRVDGHISSSDDFVVQPKVLDGASDLFKKILGEKAGHARAVFGYSSLPAEICSTSPDNYLFQMANWFTKGRLAQS